MIRRCRYSVPLPDRSPLQLGERTLVMGVVNVTPDSFSDGGRWQEPERAGDHAMDMEAAERRLGVRIPGLCEREPLLTRPMKIARLVRCPPGFKIR